MAFDEQKAIADAALAARGLERSLPYPPAAEYLRTARERVGLSEEALRLRLGSGVHLCPALELYDSELFQCAEVSTLVSLASALETSVAALLYGEAPVSALAPVSCAEVTRRIRETLAATGATADQFGDRVGWSVEAVLQEPDTLATYNVQGLRDICAGVGVDWMCVLAWLESDATQQGPGRVEGRRGTP